MEYAIKDMESFFVDCYSILARRTKEQFAVSWPI